jgi:hypothetical protein
MTTDPSTKPPWLDSQAEVVTCKYESGAGQVLAFGIPSSNHFLITFTYYAHGKTYTDEFTSPTYLEQGATFSITYNPLAPQQTASQSRRPLPEPHSSPSASQVPRFSLSSGWRSCVAATSSKQQQSPPNPTPPPEPASPSDNSPHALRRSNPAAPLHP